MKAIINTKEISVINVYHSVYDVVYELAIQKTWEALTDEEITNLKHLTDYDYQDYIVINESEVITTDHLSGDVVAYNHIETFIRMAIEAATAEE